MSHKATRDVEAALSRPENQDLSPLDRLVFTKLGNYCGDKKHGETAWPAIETLARQAARSTRTVRRSLEKLEARGLIIRDKTGGRGNTGLRYRIPEPRKNDTHGCHPLDAVNGDQDGDRYTGKGDSFDHERVTKTTVKGDSLALPLYEQEEGTEDERAQAPRGLFAQSPKKPGLHAGEPPDNQSYGEWLKACRDGPLMTQARAWVKRYAPGCNFLDSVTEEYLSEFDSWDEFEEWLNDRAGEPVLLRRVAKGG